MLKKTFEGWTDQTIAIAVRMWGEDASAAEVGYVLGTSRNAVLGFMNRRRDLFPKKTEPTTMPDGEAQERAKWFMWNRDTIAVAVKMYADMATQAEIASALGCGMNTVGSFIKKNRDIFPHRAAPAPRSSHRSAPSLKAITTAEVSAFQSDPTTWKTLLDLDDRCCKWSMEGDAASTLFCAAKTITGQSWCAHHYRLVFRPREAA